MIFRSRVFEVSLRSKCYMESEFPFIFIPIWVKFIFILINFHIGYFEGDIIIGFSGKNDILVVSIMWFYFLFEWAHNPIERFPIGFNLIIFHFKCNLFLSRLRINHLEYLVCRSSYFYCFPLDECLWLSLLHLHIHIWTLLHLSALEIRLMFLPLCVSQVTTLIRVQS